MSQHTYVLQTWNKEKRVHEDLIGLSLDAAREVASTHMLLLGFTSRIIREGEGEDYMEVFDPKRGVRRGTFAETTLVGQV